jgi:hypothetical protein
VEDRCDPEVRCGSAEGVLLWCLLGWSALGGRDFAFWREDVPTESSGMELFLISLTGIHPVGSGKGLKLPIGIVKSMLLCYYNLVLQNFGSFCSFDGYPCPRLVI